MGRILPLPIWSQNQLIFQDVLLFLSSEHEALFREARLPEMTCHGLECLQRDLRGQEAELWPLLSRCPRESDFEVLLDVIDGMQLRKQ